MWWNKEEYSALTNYLDDFLFLALHKLICDAMLKIFLEVCNQIAVPLSLDKTKWRTTIIVFLGVLLNGKRAILVIPEDKRIQAIHDLHNFVDKKKATVKELQQLTGLLNFTCKAVYPGQRTSQVIVYPIDMDGIIPESSQYG